jgi:serine protease
MKQIAFLILITTSLVFAQSKIVLDTEGRKIIDKTVMIKVKSEFKDNCSDNEIVLPELKYRLSTLGNVKLVRMFKHRAKDTFTKTQLKNGFVDISLIYKMEYTADISVEKAISLLLNSKVLQYAEPSFFDDLMYVPNDPYAQIGSGLQDEYLAQIKAYDAWDIEKGDSTMSIASVDTGIRFNHEDLKNMVYINWAEYPENGIDDDDNGYIDDYRGWDVTRDENDPEFEHWHGPFVAGCSSAEPDNGKGVVGTGYNCRITPVKVYNWEPVGGNWQFTAFDGYGGVVYAAESGAKVMNLAWGSVGNYSSIAQDIINYAAINKDVTIVASAGNSAPRQNYYPASYDNVLSVSGVTWQDNYIPDITRSYFIDITAPYLVYTTDWFGDTIYSPLIGGTSFSAPLVAGAVGLVRNKFPNLNSLQAMEQIRVTADNIDTVGTNETYYGEFGFGRLNMFAALTDTLKTSVRALNSNFIRTLPSDDTAKISYTFQNFLYAVNNLKVTLRVFSSNITLIDSVFNIGTLNTLDTISNFETSFKWLINHTASANELILFRLIFEGDNYSDYQNVLFRVAPDFIDVSKNSITTTVTSRGRIGYNNDARTEGRGFIYRGSDLLWDMGLIMTTSPDSVSSSVRTTSNVTNEYISNKNVFEKLQDKISLADYKSDFTDSLSVNKLNVNVKQTSYFWNTLGHRKYFIAEYVVTNNTPNAVDNFYLGHFADWDIQNAYRNRAKADTVNKIGFIYMADTAASFNGNRLFAAIKPLTHLNKSRFYSIDNDPAVSGNPFGNWDGFTDEEKYISLASSSPKLDAGFDVEQGRDVSHVVGNGPFTIGASDSIVVAFAIIGADSLQDMYISATNAQYLYNQSKAPMPVLGEQIACFGQNVVLTPTGANYFKFYQSASSVVPLDSGLTYTINNFTTTRSVFITNADSSYESRRLRVIITLMPTKTAFTASMDTFRIGVDNAIEFVSTGPEASSYSWNFGDSNTANGENVQYSYTTPGVYKVYLTATYSEYNCAVADSMQIVVLDPLAVKSPQQLITAYVRPTISENEVNVFVTENTELLITDIAGRVLTNEKLNRGANTVYLANYPKGMYLFKIEEKTFKVIKE